MLDVIEIDWVAPCWVQVMPSGERSPVTTLPTRVIRTQ